MKTYGNLDMNNIPDISLLTSIMDRNFLYQVQTLKLKITDGLIRKLENGEYDLDDNNQVKVSLSFSNNFSYTIPCAYYTTQDLSVGNNLRMEQGVFCITSKHLDKIIPCFEVKGYKLSYTFYSGSCTITITFNKIKENTYYAGL